MKEIIPKNLCTGCTACMVNCPKNAITMIEDKEGFRYPIINQEKCINCGKCKKICPVLNTKKYNAINDCYVAYNKNDEERMTSSSGGVFSLLANYILENNGIVIGATFDENNNKLKHIAINKVKDLEKLKGSKYLQSNLDNIFTYIKENIESKKILFVGTPCQVAGLRVFIKEDFNNLYCIDLICHGVPSPKLFSKYIKELEDKNNDKIISYNFRDKRTGWYDYSNNIVFNNKEISQFNQENDYMNLFLSDIALRKSCYQCNFKLGNKYSDITLGDFWGVDNIYPQFYDNKGTSCIIVNTNKGEELFTIIKDKLMYEKCSLNEISKYNLSLLESAKCSSKRTEFFKEIDNYSIHKLCYKYGRKRSLVEKLKFKIKKELIKGGKYAKHKSKF